MHSFIKVNGLSCQLNGLSIIEKLSLEIYANTHHMLFAPSGAGKTTLIRILLGLEKSYHGEIAFNINCKDIAVVLQKPALLPHRNLIDNLCYAAKLKSAELTVGNDTLLEEWIRITHLADYLSFFPYQLSGGMKQKAAIARAFLSDPKLVFMDEPFNSIDTASRNKIVDFIQFRYPEIATFTISHNLDDLASLQQKIVFASHQRPLAQLQRFKINSNEIETIKIFNRFLSENF